jgi:hypothetical protein
MRLSSFFSLLVFGSLLPFVLATDGERKLLRGLKKERSAAFEASSGIVEGVLSKTGIRDLQNCPPNGYWEASADKCSCYSWDVWTGDACCPASAYFDWDTNQCTCNSGYQWDGSKCIGGSQSCPPNGYWESSANKCSCHSWDVWTGDACCPANGHFAWNENKCTCNSGYQLDGSSCIDTTPPPPRITPVAQCSGNGGACGCGLGGDGHIISMNKFFGDSNDEKVWGCGGAFKLDGATWNSQWGGTISETGPEASVMNSVGLTFSSSASYDGWEGCCLICGVNLQIEGKLSDGWYCEKDLFSTGIWLKGTNK